jgi:hypothetical protein
VSDINYPQCIRELLDSEILGEAASLALYDVAKNPSEKYQFGTLLQLETETKARLRPFLYKYQISLQEHVQPEEVEGIVKLYLESSWLEFVETFHSMVAQFVVRFEEIESVGPEEDRAILQSMIVHESAILKWLEMQLTGEESNSLDAIIDQLQYPLPKL